MRTHIGCLIVLAAATAAQAQRSDLGVTGLSGVSSNLRVGVNGVGGLRDPYNYSVRGYSGFSTGGRDVNTGPLSTSIDAGLPATGVTAGTSSRLWGAPGGLSNALRVNAAAGTLPALTSSGGGTTLDSTSIVIPELQYRSSQAASGLPALNPSLPPAATVKATGTPPATSVAPAPPPTAGAAPRLATGQRFDLTAALASNAHWQRGVDLLKAGRFAEAAEALRVGIVFTPNRAEGEWLLAVAAAASEDYAEAVFRLRNALSLCPELLSQRRGAAGLLPDAIAQNRAAAPAEASAERRLTAAWLAAELGRADAVLIGPARELSGAAVPVAAALQAAGVGGGLPASDATSSKS